ncbi:MAG: hypothetical protein H7Y41_01490 [Hyphomonadaceae bacterium]|nr:hypothetical protein [Clostridia bacterium]
MADNILDKIAPFKELLQNEQAQEALKALMGLMQNSNSSSTNTTHPEPKFEAQIAPAQHIPEQPSASKLSIDDTMTTIMRIKEVYDKVSTAPDSRVNLLMALKPYLNSRRNSKIDSAIQMVQFTKISKIMTEL